MRISLTQKIIGGFATAFLLILVIAGVAYWNTARILDSVDHFVESDTTALQVEQTASHLRDVQAGLDGYVITGEASYLARYEAASRNLDSDVTKLREVVAEGPVHRGSVEELVGLVATYKRAGDNIIALRRDQGFNAARESLLTGQREQVKGQIGDVTAQIGVDERARHAALSSGTRSVAKQTTYVIIGGAGLVLLVALLAIVSILRQIGKRRQAVGELDQFFAVSPAMLAIADFDGYFTRLNPLWSDTLGWTVEELLSKPYLEFVHPDDRDATVAAAARQTAEGKTVLSFNNRYVCKDGSYRWLEWHSAPFQDKLCAIARDITALHETEDALRESEARHRSVIDNIVDGVIVIDQDGRVESFNEAAERIFGYSASEVIGQNVRMLMPEPYRGEHDQYLHNYRSGGPKKIIGIGREVEGRRKTGERFPLELAVSEIVSENRHTFVGITRDISERKRAEEALRESEERHRAVVDNIVDGIVLIGAQGRIEAFNTAAEQIFGYSAAEVIGENVRMLMPEPYRGEHDQYLDNYNSGGPKKIIGIGREVEGLRKNGERFPLDLAVSEISLDGLTTYVGITRDISERKRAEEAASHSAELLKVATMESTADGILVTSLTSGVTYYNSRFLTMWGISADVLESGDLGQLAAALLAQVEEPGPFVRRAEELNGTAEESYETISFKDGRVFERYSRPLLDVDGVAGRVWSFRDITKREQAVRSLRESEERFRSLVQNGTDVITVIDREGKITYASPSSERLMGYSPAELHGVQLVTLIHPVTSRWR